MKPTQQQPKEQPATVQAGYYAAEMFTAHAARLHVFGLIVVGAYHHILDCLFTYLA